MRSIRVALLLAALAPFASWCSSATHAVLPLVATDAGVRLQLAAGIDSRTGQSGPPGRPSAPPTPARSSSLRVPDSAPR